MSRFFCIACEVLARPLYLCAAQSPHVIDFRLLQRGLHEEPKKLNNALQQNIDQAESSGYEAILLGYGLCGNGTIGLKAGSIPIIIPRVHDCISLLLGSSQRYLDQFNQDPGTYWYSQDFMERSDHSGKFSSLGMISDQDLAGQYQTFVDKYGEENARYLMETMAGWQSHYDRAAFIDLGIIDPQENVQKVENDANSRGWKFEKLVGELLIFRQLLNGDWKEKSSEQFLLIHPGKSIKADFDGCLFSCAE